MIVPGRYVFLAMLVLAAPAAAWDTPRPQAPSVCAGGQCAAPTIAAPTPARPWTPAISTPDPLTCTVGSCGGGNVYVPAPTTLPGPAIHAPAPMLGCLDCAAPAVTPTPTIPGPHIVTVGGGGAGASASASSTAIAIASAQTGDIVIRTRQGLSAMASAEAASADGSETAFSANAAIAGDGMVSVVIAAQCVSADGRTEPAAQTFAGREAPEGFEGELYRCPAGTRASVTSEGRTTQCAAGQSVWVVAGQILCRERTPQAAGYERMLMGRFGPGEKQVRVRAPAPRQTTVMRDANPGLTSGGVGQGAW